MLADTLRRTGGGVVLLHDFDRGDANSDMLAMAKLEAVLALRNEGYRFVTFGQLQQLQRGQPLAHIRPRGEPAQVTPMPVQPAPATGHPARKTARGA